MPCHNQVYIPINIDMCNTFGVYFQIFKTFGYKKLKNSEFYRFPPILSKEKSSFFLQMIRSVLGDFILYGLN